MSLAHVLLTSLLEKPNSGYALAARFDKSMGFFWNASHQQIYRELKRMEEQGWISSSAALDAGKTKKKTYEVLEAGKIELKQWTLLATDPSQIREEMAVRLRAEAILGPLGVVEELKRHLAINEEKLALYLSIEQRDFKKHDTLTREQQIQYRVLILGIEALKTWIKWAKETIEMFEQLD